jgi:hypothetical protein
MAKDPKLGGLRPGDDNYKLLLEGIAKRQEATAKKQEQAASTTEEAASEIQSNAKTIVAASEEQAKATSDIVDIIREMHTSINAFTKAANSGTTENIKIDADSKNGAVNDKRSSIFVDILDISKDILKATEVNSTVLLDILSAILNQNQLTNANRKQTATGGNTSRTQTQSNSSDSSAGSVDLGSLLTGLAIGLGAIVGSARGWVKAISTLTEIFKSTVKLISSIVELLWEGIKSVSKTLETIASKIEGTLGNAFDSVATAIGDSIKAVKEFFSKKVQSVLDVFEESFNFVKRIFTVGEESGVGKLFSGFKQVISNVGEVLLKIIEPFMDAFKLLGSLIADSGPVTGLFKTLSSFAKLFKAVAFIAEKIAFPLMIVMAVWDTVKGAMEGYQKEGIVGAIKGAFTGLFDSLIGGLLDLLKDATSWVLKQLGFENASKFLDSFSFQDIFKKMVDAIADAIGWVIDKISGVFKSIGSAVSTALSNIPGVSWIVDKFKSWFGGNETSTTSNPNVTTNGSNRSIAQARMAERAVTQTSIVETPFYDADGNQIGTSITPIVGDTQATPTNLTPSNEPVVRNSQHLQKMAESASNSTAAAPVIVNNNTVNNNNGGGAGTGSTQGPATGGSVATAPMRGPLDRTIYGYNYGAGYP